MHKNIEGGCFCRELRYKITGPAVLQLFCFCKDCLTLSGTDGYAGYMVKNEDFHLTKGTPTKFNKKVKDNRTVVRHFCSTCGTNIWGKTEFGIISVAAGSLDDPTIFKPSKKTFAHDAPPWARVPDELEEF